jgi:hypothetical protein
MKENILESEDFNLRYVNTKYLTEYRIISIKDMDVLYFLFLFNQDVK